MAQPFKTAIRYSSLILSEVAWSPFELLRSIDSKYNVYYANIIF